MPAAFALSVVMSAVSTAITMSMTRFSVLFVPSFIFYLLSSFLFTTDSTDFTDSSRPVIKFLSIFHRFRDGGDKGND